MLICNTSRVFPSTREPTRAVIRAQSPPAGTGPPAHRADCCSQRDPVSLLVSPCTQPARLELLPSLKPEKPASTAFPISSHKL